MTAGRKAETDSKMFLASKKQTKDCWFSGQREYNGNSLKILSSTGERWSEKTLQKRFVKVLLEHTQVL